MNQLKLNALYITGSKFYPSEDSTDAIVQKNISQRAQCAVGALSINCVKIAQTAHKNCAVVFSIKKLRKIHKNHHHCYFHSGEF